MRVVSRIQKELKIKVELKHIFACPTIQELAIAIAEFEQSKSEIVKNTSQEDYYDLSWGQKGIVAKKGHIVKNSPYLTWDILLYLIH